MLRKGKNLPNFTKLRIWVLFHELTLKIYKISISFPKQEQYNLTSQIRRAVVSVESNISESHGRYHYSDSVNFLINSRGSAHEVQTQLMIVSDLGYANKPIANSLVDKYTELIKQINSLISYKRKNKGLN